MSSDRKSAGSRKLLGLLPAELEAELRLALDTILRNYRERRWEPSELNGGKLCEVVITILQGFVKGAYRARAAKPPNMVTACQKMEQAGQQFPRSIRILIPRVLIALYEIRNNRGVGHTGGDVNPNHMDATVVVAMSKWVVAELVRLFHDVSTKEAAEIVESLVDRSIPVVWEVNGKKRILDPGLSYSDKTMLLLYHCSRAVSDKELFRWVEHSNYSVYRRSVLGRGHRDKLLEYDESERTVQISPRGVEQVERALALHLAGG